MRAMTEDERETYEKMKALRAGCGSEDEFTRSVAFAIAFRDEEIKRLQRAIATMIGVDASPKLQPAPPKPVCAMHHDLCGCAAHT